MEDIFIEKFNIYTNNKNHLTIDDFLLYFANMAQENIDITYKFLENLGYTKSLDYYLNVIEKDNILYYEKNNKKELMPRYFISNNIKYLKKLFNVLQTDNEEIHNMTKDIINELSTPDILKKVIFEENSYGNKLDEILYDDNLELKVYLYDIIITIFNEKLNFDRKKITSFIRNHLEKIINEFDKINKSNNFQNLFNKKQYINYYASITKLLFLCCRRYISHKEINDYIDKSGEENKEINPVNFKLDLKGERFTFIKKINIPNLLETILNNILLLNGKENIKEIKLINSTKLILYLILLISNYYEEKDKIDIYKIFIEKQRNILFNCSSYEITENVFNMIKYIYPLMSDEENQLFLKMQNEEIINYLKDYKKLYSVKGDVIYLFDLFYIYIMYLKI